MNVGIFSKIDRFCRDDGGNEDDWWVPFAVALSSTEKGLCCRCGFGLLFPLQETEEEEADVVYLTSTSKDPCERQNSRRRLRCLDW